MQNAGGGYRGPTEAYAKTEIGAWGVRDLKRYLAEHHINATGCVERQDLVALVIQNEERKKSQPKQPPPWQQEQQKQQYSSSSTRGGYTHQPQKPSAPLPEASLSFYELLEVEKSATQVEIKKAYYKKAREWHPDRNPDNPMADEMFKLINEAYQILSDDKKKEMYDKYGKDYLRTAEAGGEVDLSFAFKMLFGAGKFDDVIGEMNLFSAFLEEGEEAAEEVKGKKQQERIEKLATHLRFIKLEPYVAHSQKEWVELIEHDIEEKLEVPGGASLLLHIGYIYVQEAKQHDNRWLGLESFVSELSEKGHFVSEAVSLLSEARKIQMVQQQLEGSGPQDTDIQIKALNQGINLVWKLGKLEIEQTLRQVCEKMIKDCKEKKVRKRVVEGLRKLGEMYQKAAKKVGGARRAAPTLDDFGEHFGGSAPKQESPESAKGQAKAKAKDERWL